MDQKKRERLHEILCDLIGPFPDGESHVYFVAPSEYNMRYPCIRYSFSGTDSSNADNSRYLQKDRYTIMVIDENPESDIPGKILQLPYCSFDRPPFISDGLNHFVFTLYF